MSLENENQGSPDEGGSDNLDVVSKKPKITYQREFLLSLSNLDICKKLPSGFDESLLSEFEESVQAIQDRPRGLPYQGFRRNEHGSSPPTQGDSGNYSRGIYGKWEHRFSGRSDRESESQSDRDSDSGGHCGNQSRRSWQTTEQDGLLGSGSFARASGHATGISALEVRANEHYQLSKSNEPYHLPRPYKAVPYSRRDTDSKNNETFGSAECDNEDRAEEEKRRRASFEMMRKEQQRSLQEKQKLNQERHKSGDVSDLREMLEGEKEEKGPLLRDHELEVSAATPTLSNDLEKCSLASHSPASRPLVPPGFRNNVAEKIFGLKSPLHHPSLEEGKSVSGESLLHAEHLVQNGINFGLERKLSQEISSVDGQPLENTPVLDKGENVNLRTSLDVHIRKPGMEDQLPHASGHLHSHGTLDDLEIVELNADALEDKIAGDSKRSFPTSILEKIFGSTLSINDDGSNSAEHHDGKPDDSWSPNSVQSSKFAQWFFEEEAKPAEDISTARPNDLLSLIVSGDKGRYQVSDSEAAEHFPRDFSHNILEQSDKLVLDLPSAATRVSDQACANNKEEIIPTVLTCKDLEQSILTKYTANTTDIQPPLNEVDATSEQPSEHVDDSASLHLLSLLQKGTDQSKMTPNSGVDISLTEKPLISQEYTMGTAVNEPKGKENAKNILDSGKTVTLETLFGSAFMKELQSVEAPVSVQRGSTGSDEVYAQEPRGLRLPVTENGISSSAIDKIGLEDDRVIPSKKVEQLEPSKANNWLHFDDYQTGATSSKHYPKEVPSGFERENVNSVGDPWNNQMFTFLPTDNPINDVKFSSNAFSDIMNKLAAPIKDERVVVGSESMAFTRDPYRNMEPELPYQSLQVQQPAPQLQPPQMAQARPLNNQLDSHLIHMSSHLKFSGPEPLFRNDSPANQQFPSNMIQHPFHPPNIGNGGFDFPPSMLHQMQIPRNHAPRISPDFLRTGPISHHGIHNTNQIQGFPLGTHQPLGSHGLPMPAPDLNPGRNPPDAFQRLIEMELRANSKRNHPFAPDHNPGIHGRELDMGFRHR